MRTPEVLTISERERIIGPEVEALFEDDYYNQLLESVRDSKLKEKMQYVLPVSSFLARAARRTLAERQARGGLPHEVKARVRAGVYEVQQVGMICDEMNVFADYHRVKRFGAVGLQLKGHANGISVFTQAIYYDTGWVVGGVMSKLAHEMPGNDQDVATVIKRSTSLQRIGAMPEFELDRIRPRFGKPYIAPEHLQFSTEGSLPDSALTARYSAALALEITSLTDRNSGCPARSIQTPIGDTMFRAEWNQLADYFTADSGRAHVPITRKTPDL
jgi:hypothetical protein